MSVRNSQFMGLISQKVWICLFAATSMFFIFSWFFLSVSTRQIQFLESKPLAQTILQNSVLYDGNRSMLDGSKERRGQQMMQKKEECICNDTEVPEPLKVYMYDMDPEFHFGLLGWKPKGNTVWPDIRTEIPHHPGGLNLQHSIEYWLTLDLLFSEIPQTSNTPRAAIRVPNSTAADVIFVPFFSSLSYNRHSRLSPGQKISRNKELQEKLVKFVTSQKEWRNSGGRDHLVLAHHPNSMLNARTKLNPAIFILSDFGRYPPDIANVDKDVIAPYKHVVRSYSNDASSFDSRPILMFFQGAIYRKDVSLFLDSMSLMMKLNSAFSDL